MSQSDLSINKLTEAVIGASIDVHRELGPGFLESVYEAALSIELSERGIAHPRQHEISVSYKGHPVGKGIIDILVE